MRITIELMAVKPHPFDQCADPVQPVARREAWLVGAQGLREDLQDIHSRIERGQWILKHHLDLPAHLEPAFGVRTGTRAETCIRTDPGHGCHFLIKPAK